MLDPYLRFQATADRLIGKWKQGTVTLTRTIQGTPNPETPWIPAPSETRTYTLDAVVRDVATKYVDGTEILATDVQVTASTKMSWTATNGVAITPSTVRYEPSPGDVMAIDGDGVTIVKTMRIPRAGTALAWRFIVRG